MTNQDKEAIQGRIRVMAVMLQGFCDEYAIQVESDRCSLFVRSVLGVQRELEEIANHPCLNSNM